MKHLMRLSIFVLMLLQVAVSYAQDSRTVSGTVMDDTGQPAVFISVQLQGTSNQTQTDERGVFAITVPAGAQTLVFSGVGYETLNRAVAAGETNIQVRVTQNVEELSEVVVTALNIPREKRSLGYSVQQVDSEELSKARPTDVATALAGKVSGIQVFGAQSGSFSGSRIRIRGVNDLGANGPLYVIDGTPVSHSDVDMQNVASVSVLKGPSAAALYGQRASRGVILITTKTGSRNQPMTIEVNSTTKFEGIAAYPRVQNLYGQGVQRGDGEAYEFPIFQYDPSRHPQEWQAWDGQPRVEYNTEMSWGPRLDGQMVREWSSWYPDDPDYGKLTPFSAHNNNIRDFYRTGHSFQNDISMSGGGENYKARLGYNNQRRQLVFPGSDRNRHFFNAAGEYDVAKKLTISSNISIVKDFINANPERSFNIINTMQSDFPRNVDVDKLRNYDAGKFRFRTWQLLNPNTNTAEDFLYNKQISGNPFVENFENVGTDELTRVYGNVQLSYQIADNLKIQGAYRTDYNAGDYDFRIVSGSRPNNADGTTNDSYSKTLHSSVENNYEVLLSYRKALENFSFDGNLGGNIRHNKSESVGANTSGGLKVPGVYAISQSFRKPDAYDAFSSHQVRSIFGRGSVGYKSILYVDGSLRNDWSSALPVDNNSYLYPAVSTSFVFSELTDNLVSSDILSFGKLRMGVAQVGSDMAPYNVYTTLPLTTGYGTFPGQGLSSRMLNPSIRPALSTSYEAGLELQFFNNRVGVDFSVYKNVNKDQILEMQIPTVSGYNSMMINAGLIETKGYELSISGSPIRSENIQWDMNVNLGKTNSIVKRLAEGQKELQIVYEFSELYVNHVEGEEWGLMRGRKIRRYQAMDAKGNPIAHENNGKTVVSNEGQVLYDENQEFGSVMPDFTGGLYNSINYKNFDLSFMADFQVGGLFFAKTTMMQDYKGASEKTVALNENGVNIREPLSAGGGIKPENAVTANGVPFDRHVPAMGYFGTYWWLSEPYIFDASYVKMREIRLGYSIPERVFKNSMVKGINLGVVVNNAFLIYNAAKDSGKDPSEANTNYGDAGQLPSTRSLGFNLRVNL